MFGRVLALLAVSLLSSGVFASAQAPVPAELSANQEQEHLWVPEGYRLLSNEERQALSADELKAVLSRNNAILDAAARQMSSEARAAVIANHQQVSGLKELSPAEKQYVARTAMLLLSVTVQEEDQKERKAQEAAFAQLLKKQEDSTSGFPADQKSVETEAMDIRNLLGKGEDLRKLYLRILRPLRSRPWNETARVTLRQLLRSDPVSTIPEARKRNKSLIEAALAFIEARRAEAPGEGAWDSLEAFLRLSFLHEIAPAKKLFALAVAKDAQDVESHLYPLLIAEIEEDADAIRTYLPRARKAWPGKEELDRVLFEEIGLLPPDLRAKARGTLEARYKKAYPLDWESRRRLLAQKLWDRRFREADPKLWDQQVQEVESETRTFLVLPHTILPEPHRIHLRSMNLRAKAGLGACELAHGEVADFEAEAKRAYRAEEDSSSPPRDDFAGPGASLGIELRAAVGNCYLEKKAALEAAQVLKPCAGSGQNIHRACAEPLVDAGLQLVSGGNIPAAVEIYRLVGPGYSGARRLHDALEQAAPGAVQRFETPPPPRTTPPSAN